MQQHKTFYSTLHPFDCGHLLIGGFPRYGALFGINETQKDLKQLINRFSGIDRDMITQISCTLLYSQKEIRTILRKLGFKKTPDRLYNKHSKKNTICIYYWENPYYLKKAK